MIVVATTALGIALALAGGYVLVIGLRYTYRMGAWVRQLRQIARLEPVSVAEVPDASPPVQFGGTATEGEDELIEAPLSGTECLAVRVEWSDRAATAEGNAWQPAAERTASTPFVVTEDGHRIGVDPDGADWGLGAWDETIELDAGDRLDDAVLDRLDAMALDDDHDSDTPDVDSERRIRERRLDPGEEVDVVASEVTRRTQNWGAGPEFEVTDGPAFHIATGDVNDDWSELFGMSGLFVVAIGLIFVAASTLLLAGLALLYGTWIA